MKSKCKGFNIRLQFHNKFTPQLLNSSVESWGLLPGPEIHTPLKAYALAKRLFTGMGYVGLLIYLHFHVFTSLSAALFNTRNGQL